MNWKARPHSLADSPLAIDKDKHNGAHLNELLSQIDDVSEPTFHYFP
jgi:hypothetical protein